jgi:hypothetical protein
MPQTLLKKFVTQMVSKFLFIDPENSTPFAKKSTTGSYPQLIE